MNRILPFRAPSPATRGGSDSAAPFPARPGEPTSLQLKLLEERLCKTELGAVSALALLAQLAPASGDRDSTQMVLLAMDLGRRAGLADAELGELEAAALLHDVGFLCLPEGLLHKPGRLNAWERRLLRGHPEVADRILRQLPGFERAAGIVRHHHERLDGRGYPAALRGGSIPLASRILAVAEGFNAMLGERSYRPSLPLEEAVRRLEADAGSRFDPEVVRLVTRSAEEFHRLIAAAERRPGHPSSGRTRGGALYRVHLSAWLH